MAGNLRHINEVTFEGFTLHGIQALVTDERFDKKTLPDGYYAYDLRGSDYDCGKPATVEPFVYVNYIGTVVTRTPIDMGQGKDQYNSLGDDWSYSASINEFGEKFSYHPKDDVWTCIA